MLRSVIRTLVGIAAGALVIPVTANEGLPRLGLINLKMIPGAPELGWVEVMRQNDTGNPGWYCHEVGGSHLYALQRLREGKAMIPLDIAEKGALAIYEYEAQHGGLPAVGSAFWEQYLGLYLMERLTLFSKSGKPELRMPKPSLTWRDWLRQTLEEINRKADRKGMTEARKRQALINWVMCHISETHAEQLRQFIHDNDLENRINK